MKSGGHLALIAEQDKIVPKYSSYGGGGDGMDGRIAKLESDVGYVLSGVAELKSDVREMRSEFRSEIRLLLGAGGVAVCALLTVMAKGFGWL